MSVEKLELVKRLPKEKIKSSLRELLRNMDREELVKLLESTSHLAQQDESRFMYYKPVSDVALEFHKSRARIRLLLGGNRASKTVTATVDTHILVTQKVPGHLEGLIPPERIKPGAKIVRIVATDYPNGIQKIMKPKLVEWAPAGELLSYSEDLQIATFKNGSKVELMSCEQPLIKHGGTARHRVHFDEEPPEVYFDEALMRIMDYGGDIVISMTPVNGMSWTYDRLYLKAHRVVSLITDETGRRHIYERTNPEGDKDIEVFVMSSRDNYYLDQETRKAIERQILDEEERRMRIEGEYVSFSGLVYKSFDSRIHVVKPFKIPGLKEYLATRDPSKLPWPVYCALDPHPRTEHAYLMCAVDPWGRKFFFDEFFEDLDIRPLAERIKLAEQDYWVIWRLIDPSADIEDRVGKSLVHGGVEGEATTLLSELQKYGLSFQLAPRTLSTGILRVREGLAIRDREGTSGRVKMPEIYFFNTLKRTIWEIQRYQFDSWRKAEADKNPKQKPKDKDDHMMENLYRIMVREPMWLDYEQINEPLGDDWRTCP